VLPIADETVSQSSKEIARGSFWTLGGNAFYKIISFLYVIIIARMATEAEVGLFYLAFGILQIIGIIAHVGLPASLQRFVPFYESRKELGKIRHLLLLSFGVVIVSTIIFTILIWMSADFIAALYESPMLGDALKLFSFYVLLFGISKIQISYLQGRTDMKAMQFVLNIQNLLKLGLTFIFFFALGPTALNMILGFLAAILIADLAGLILLWNRSKKLSTSGGGISKNELLRDVVPLGLTLSAVSSIAIFIAASDKILLGYLIPDSFDMVGIYSVATSFALMLLIFPMSFGQIFMPIISRLVGKNDISEIRKTTANAMRWSMLVTIPVAVVLVSFSSDILATIYGESYGLGGLALSIFLLGVMVKAFSYMLIYVIAAMRKIMVELKINFAMGLLNVILTVLLIPILGMEGAAFASFLSFLFAFILLRHYAGKLFKFQIPRQAYLLLIAGFVTLVLFLGLSTFISPQEFLPLAGLSGKTIFLAFLGVMGAVSASIFGALAILLKCFKGEDRALLQSIFRKFKVPEPVPTMATRLISFGIADK
jgi:O-antigen/teichoic acid export membrane protein